MTVTTERQNLRERALQSLGQLPPFSPILNRLLASLAHEDVSFVKIAELIEKDTVLAGNVLRLVNSALYGRRSTVNSVRHAVSLLGINKLRNATLGMSITRMWNQVRTPRGWSMARFNLHSVGTAMLADVLSQSCDADYAEGAFAAGLFHDLGRLLIAIGLPDEHNQITRMYSGASFRRHECEMELLGFTHAELSGDALAVWNLPEEIGIAVRHHHDPDSAPPVDAAVSLSKLIALADEMINALGYNIEQTPPPSADEARQQLEALELRQPLTTLLESFNTEFQAMRAMF